jgi:hypothetical protein
MVELYPQLRQLGPPWYLRRAGAKAMTAGDGASEITFDSGLSGHRPGGQFSDATAPVAPKFEEIRKVST